MKADGLGAVPRSSIMSSSGMIAFFRTSCAMIAMSRPVFSCRGAMIRMTLALSPSSASALPHFAHGGVATFSSSDREAWAEPPFASAQQLQPCVCVNPIGFTPLSRGRSHGGPGDVCFAQRPEVWLGLCFPWEKPREGADRLGASGKSASVSCEELKRRDLTIQRMYTEKVGEGWKNRGRLLWQRACGTATFLVTPSSDQLGTTWAIV